MKTEERINEMKKMIEGLRDDAPVFPLWTIGDLKALINEARIEELNIILNFPPKTLTLFKKSIKARRRELKRLTNND